MGRAAALDQIVLGVNLISSVNGQVNAVDFIQGGEGNAVLLGQHRCLK